ncbi:Bax inhibitor-1/YccA family protein [uncultured Rothia sp.]|uniref:Bax inhibitor-1/YccA family protein n=1 Tax=uncultured Rothia sp. TaxID=316088 RepID=UPI003217D694
MAGNPLIQSMTNSQKQDSRFGRFGADTANGQNSYGTSSYQSAYGQSQYTQPSAEELDTMYQAPSAGPAETNRLTINDVIVKTGLNLGLVVVGAAMGWFFPILMFLGVIGGLVLGLVNSFKKKVSPALVMAYSLLEGMALGGISMFFETQYPGIVSQAVLGTVLVFVTMLVLFRSGKVRASSKATKIFLGAMIAYGVFCLINIGSALFLDTNMRSIEVFGIPIGFFIGLIAILMGAYSLVLDFTNVGEAVQAGVPERESWRLAFGLVVTLLWLYIEILRVISYIRSMADN